MANIGQMRSYCTIERRAVTQDAVGEQTWGWTQVGAGLWAEIKALSGRELQAAQAVRATDTSEITIRYWPGLSEKDRLVYADPEGTVWYYNITSVNDLEMKHRYMVLTAAQGLAAG